MLNEKGQSQRPQVMCLLTLKCLEQTNLHTESELVAVKSCRKGKMEVISKGYRVSLRKNKCPKVR